MAKYKCSVCGYIYDEEKEKISFSALKECPVCKQNVSAFQEQKDIEIRTNEYRYMREIQEMAVTGKPVIEAMGTKMKMPDWDDILIMGAQLNPMPLDEHAPVDTQTVIGKHAKKPMVLSGPVYISHMSFGALSKEVKTALAKGSAMAGTAICSGEGGILPEERAAAEKYIFEYVPNLYSVTPENLKNSDAIEIKIGQGTKPGMGGHLPGEKVTPEIAKIRNKPQGEDIISPSRFADIQTKEDLRDLVEQLRFASKGRPIGIKIAAGRIEKDLEFCVFAQPDFVTIDGRGGATGASPRLVRDATSVPTVFAHPAAVAVEEGRCYPGIAMCGTGNGIAMTLNKHQGVRAALCWNKDLARLAREHNDANVLVLPARFVEPAEALAIVDVFLSTPFEGGRHVRRIEKIAVK